MRGKQLGLLFLAVFIAGIIGNAVYVYAPGTVNTASTWGVEATNVNATTYYLNDVSLNARFGGNFDGFAFSADTINTGNGAYELFAMNQDVESTDAVTFDTVDTGEGANELYGMDQNVKTTDNVSFDSVNATDEFYRNGVNYTATIEALITAGILPGNFTLAYEDMGSPAGPRTSLNFIEGANITLTVTDDAPNDQINITITSIGGAGGGFSGYTSIVRKEGSFYICRNGDTGAVTTNSSDPAVAIEGAFTRGGAFRTIGKGETWEIQTDIDTQGDDVTWVSDWSLKIRVKDNLDTDLVDVNHDNIHFYGVFLDGNNEGQTNPATTSSSGIRGEQVSGTWVIDSKIIQCARHGVNINGFTTTKVEEIRIINSVFLDNHWNGITVQDSAHDVVIAFNHIEYSADVGIAVPANDPAGTSPTSRITVIGNTLTNFTGANQGSASTLWGISVESHKYVTITGNVINATGLHRAINTNSEIKYTGAVVIDANIIFGNGKATNSAGISAKAGYGRVTISDNFVEALYAGSAGIEIDDSGAGTTGSGGGRFIVSNNIIVANNTGGDGIRVNDVNHSLIEGNQIECDDDAIYITDSHYTVVKDNIATPSTQTPGMFINIDAASFFTWVDGNDMINCTGSVTDAGTNTVFGINRWHNSFTPSNTPP